MLKRIRKLRHWKQRYDPTAKFVWRRSVTWDGEPMVIGAEIPASLAENRTRLRRFWASNIIELLAFDEPDVVTGRVPEPVVPVVDGDDTVAGQDGNDTVTGQDGDDTVAGQDGNDTVTGQDGTDQAKATEKTAEDLVRKETDRKWLVEGLEEVFPSKGKALEAAQALLAAF
jgi:RTX calcium-binding nonapeptide repeat (4 copies)